MEDFYIKCSNCEFKDFLQDSKLLEGQSCPVCYRGKLIKAKVDERIKKLGLWLETIKALKMVKKYKLFPF